MPLQTDTQPQSPRALKLGLIVLLLLAFWCRSLIPEGFMPDMASGKAMQMAICDGGADGGQLPHHTGGMGKMPCPFAGAVYGHPPSFMPVFLSLSFIATRLTQAALWLEPVQSLHHARPRGPPAIS